jgi:hypothetical protein
VNVVPLFLAAAIVAKSSVCEVRKAELAQTVVSGKVKESVEAVELGLRTMTEYVVELDTAIENWGMSLPVMGRLCVPGLTKLPKCL